jgi:hypothetical protein
VRRKRCATGSPSYFDTIDNATIQDFEPTSLARMKFRPVFSFHVRGSVSVSAPFGVREGLGVLRGQYQASANLAPYAQILSLIAVLKCRMMLEKPGLRRLPQSLRSHGLPSENAIPMIPKRSAFSTKTRLVQCLHRCPHNRQAGNVFPNIPIGSEIMSSWS